MAPMWMIVQGYLKDRGFKYPFKVVQREAGVGISDANDTMLVDWIPGDESARDVACALIFSLEMAYGEPGHREMAIEAAERAEYERLRAKFEKSGPVKW